MNARGALRGDHLAAASSKVGGFLETAETEYAPCPQCGRQVATSRLKQHQTQTCRQRPVLDFAKLLERREDLELGALADDQLWNLAALLEDPESSVSKHHSMRRSVRRT